MLRVLLHMHTVYLLKDNMYMAFKNAYILLKKCMGGKILGSISWPQSDQIGYTVHGYTLRGGGGGAIKPNTPRKLKQLI